jgi:hypothetical protein
MLNGFKALDQSVPSAVIRSEKEFIKQREHAGHILQQLKRSESILDFLRPVPPIPRTLDQSTIQKFMKAVAGVRPADFHDDTQDSLVVDPREYLAQEFPGQINKFGPAFLGSVTMFDGRQSFISETVNELAFAAILGGDHRLGHQLVYHHMEDQFYFQDYRVEAFCPTSEEKLGILLSHYFIQCSQRCHPLAAKAVLRLRTPQTIKGIITTAKAMLEADGQFFIGKNGHRRFMDGAYLEPDSTPAHKLFVKRNMVRQKDANLTLGAAYTRYRGLCDDLHERPLTRAEFKDIVKEAVAEVYQVRLRHDVIDDATNKMTHGWRGVALVSGNEGFQLN